MGAAARLRDDLYGRRITYSPKVFVPLTMLCRDRCGYCTFAKAPARLAAPFMSIEEVVALCIAGRAEGCHEALFTLGERPEERYRAAGRWLVERGFASTVSYLEAACRAAVEDGGLLPHANAGALSEEELARLRPVSASQGMMLESLNPALGCHRLAPDKQPARRLATLEAAGRLQIPFTTGILVGIGESRRDRLGTLRAIADSHLRHGHVQEVIVQNFLPKAATAMEAAPPCAEEEHLFSIAAARLLLPPEVHLQAPPNLAADLGSLIAAGIDDLGGISPLTTDHVNPERPWPALDHLAGEARRHGFSLVARLAVHPEWAARPERFVDEALRPALLGHSDAEGLARDDCWASGGSAPPPDLVGRPRWRRALSPLASVLRAASAGERLDEAQLVTLFKARGDEVLEVCGLADDLRRRAVGDVVTFVSNRNINYTNICTFKCRFCAFSKGPLSLNLRGSPYLLDLEEITRRVGEAEAAGATEVCLQGGIHPSFDGDYYLEVLRAVRRASTDIHIHAFTALEVHEGARRLGQGLADYLLKLKEAGLRSLPGTAAEVLDDEVRRVICPDKISTARWLEVHRTAHQVGLRSNVTIMFGSVEGPAAWARHIVATRRLQEETGGFTEFVPLPFVHMAAPLYLQGRARPGPTFREAVLMHAVGRIAYHGLIDNIQASWVKMGVSGARQLLSAGCNDLGGTLMDENISRAAGASHGQRMDEAAFREITEPLGRPLRQRTTLYGDVPAIAS
jgi:FO synthase